MKKEFLEFYHPDEADFTALKKEAIFVFDACALLDLYKFPSKERNELLKIISILAEQDRVWQPHQFCYEYHQHRQEVIKVEVSNYEKISRDIETYFKELDKVTMAVSFPKHPLVKIDSITKDIKKEHKKFLKESLRKIQTLKTKHPNWSKKDPVLNRLTTLFSGKIGTEYSDAELDQKYKLGEARYKRLKPPGYEDVMKDSEDPTKTKKYGDLIAWFQIIDKAKELKKPVVLVTDDVKGDWWILDKKKHRHGPRKELVREMYAEAGVYFHMMDTGDLLEFADENLSLDISQKTISDIREVKIFFQSRENKFANLEESYPLTNDLLDTSDELEDSDEAGTPGATINPPNESNNEDDSNTLPEIQLQ